MRFRQHGKTVRQSTETTSEAKARTFLREREGKVALNIPVNVTAERLTLGAAADLIRNDYTSNGHKSADTLELRLTHLQAHLGAATRLSRITTGSVEQYKAARLAEPVTLPATKVPRVAPPNDPPKLTSPATVNREIAILARMGSLAQSSVRALGPLRGREAEGAQCPRGLLRSRGVPGGLSPAPPGTRGAGDGGEPYRLA